MFEHPWKRYVAVGDSVTEGFGMDRVEGVEHLPWATRIARALAETQPALEYHNLGYRGLRAAEIAERQLERAIALEPDLVSLAAGPNDLLAPHFTAAQIERDLEPLYARLAATGATVFSFLFMNMPASGVLPEDGARWLGERMEILHAAIERLASAHGALVIDLYNDPASANPAWWSADLQHANTAGQAYVAERTIEALEAEAARLATLTSGVIVPRRVPAQYRRHDISA